MTSQLVPDHAGFGLEGEELCFSVHCSATLHAAVVVELTQLG